MKGTRKGQTCLTGSLRKSLDKPKPDKLLGEFVDIFFMPVITHADGNDENAYGFVVYLKNNSVPLPDSADGSVFGQVACQ